MRCCVFRKLRKCKVINNMSWSFYNWWLCFCCHVLSLPLCEIFIKPSRKDKIVICSSTHTILWTKQNVKMGRLLETSRVPQKSCGKPVYLYNISFNLSRGHLLYSKDTFFLNSHRWYAHKKVVVYMAYVIELLKHILSKELKTTDSIAEMKPMVYPIWLLYAIAILFKNKLTICILNNFCC